MLVCLYPRVKLIKVLLAWDPVASANRSHCVLAVIHLTVLHEVSLQTPCIEQSCVVENLRQGDMSVHLGCLPQHVPVRLLVSCYIDTLLTLHT